MTTKHNPATEQRQSLGHIYAWIHLRAEYLRKQARLKAEAADGQTARQTSQPEAAPDEMR